MCEIPVWAPFVQGSVGALDRGLAVLSQNLFRSGVWGRLMCLLISNPPPRPHPLIVAGGSASLIIFSCLGGRGLSCLGPGLSVVVQYQNSTVEVQ